MKTNSLFGLILAVATAVLTLVIYFLGLHSDPAKLPAAQWVGGLGGLAIGVTVTALGIKARRAEVPESEDFGYGKAFGSGVQISLVAAILGSIFNYVYTAFINTGYTDVLVQNQLDKLQAKGISGNQLDQAEKMIRLFSSPVAVALMGLIIGFIFGLLISLVIAAFLKRAARGVPPLPQA